MEHKHLKEVNQLDDLLPYLHLMFDDSMENVAVHNTEANAVYMNPALKKTLGIKSHEDHQLVRESHLAPFHHLFSAIKQVISTGEPTEIFLTSPNLPTVKPVHDQIYINPIRNQSGAIIGVATIGRDISFADSQLLADEKQHSTYLRALLDTFPFVVWMKDKQGHFLEVNQHFVNIVNESGPEKLFGKTDFDYFPQAMAQGYVDDDNEVLNSGQPKIIEEQIQKTDGEVYWAKTYKSPVKIDGQVIGTVGFAQDITEKQELIAEINKKSAEYQSLVEHLPMTVIRYDRDCRRIYVNDKHANRHLGTLDYKLNLTPEEQWHPNIVNMTGSEYMHQLKQVIATGVPCDFENIMHMNETIFAFAVKLVPVYNSQVKILGALAIVQDITESYKYQEKIQHLAYYDSTTQLPNRSHFQEQLHSQLEQAKRNGSPLCVMMLDLDHFKSINDELGHNVGDHMLTEVAARLKEVIFEKALLARLGGDEFAILMVNYAASTEIIDLANEILSVMTPAFLIEERDIFLSASIGIATYPEHADAPNDLMKFADSAMYLAKRQGRNTHQFFVADINESNAFDHLLRTELRHAIQREEFFVEYQPIFDIQQTRIIKYEALLRWNSPMLGFVSPDKFIPVAEEYGLINEVGHWMMLRVCRDAVLVNRQVPAPITFALNLSPRQFIRNDLADAVRTCILSSGCQTSQLEFEITEGLLMEDSSEISSTLEFFHTQGITLSVDDFGTGYSSLSYLNKFPISTVKIDKSFIRDITTDQKDATLTKAIINMGVSLGKTLTAEGIETQEQLSLLRAWGCHHGQGYLLGRPRRLEFILEDIATNQEAKL